MRAAVSSAALLPGRCIAGVTNLDWERMLGGLRPDDFAAALVGSVITGVDRRGKLVLVRLDGGRTLALFTSYRNLQACADAAEATGVTILRQGDKPRSKLLRQFRKDEGTALFATTSFWQGVDIPGEALSCLVCTKARRSIRPPTTRKSSSLTSITRDSRRSSSGGSSTCWQN